VIASTVESSFTNLSVYPTRGISMARTKQTDRASRDQKQSGIGRAVKEYDCFVCGFKTDVLHNYQWHLARVHKKYEDGTNADEVYCDKFANKRSKKWQMRAAAAKAGTNDSCDVEPDRSPVAKSPKVKFVRRIQKVDEVESMEVGDAHTNTLHAKIKKKDIGSTLAASDATKVKGKGVIMSMLRMKSFQFTRLCFLCQQVECMRMYTAI